MQVACVADSGRPRCSRRRQVWPTSDSPTFETPPSLNGRQLRGPYAVSSDLSAERAPTQSGRRRADAPKLVRRAGSNRPVRPKCRHRRPAASPGGGGPWVSRRRDHSDFKQRNLQPARAATRKGRPNTGCSSQDKWSSLAALEFVHILSSRYTVSTLAVSIASARCSMICL